MVTVAALLVVPLVLVVVRDRPQDVGLRPYGCEDTHAPAPPGPEASRALGVLASAARTRAFWLLAGGFAICGLSTNGLIQIHFIPAAHDHGMPSTLAASLLAAIGVLDIVGTVLSGWLTDRLPAPLLLGAYYALRGGSLLVLPYLLDASAHPSLLIFIIFYGLDWVATVPPTIALCRQHFGTAGPVVFGWVFAAHMIGAALAATAAGVIRDQAGAYTFAFTGAGLLCFVAAALSLRLSSPAPPEDDEPAGSEQAGPGRGDHDRGVAAGGGM